MGIRRVLVPLAVVGVSLLTVHDAASAAPVTKQNFTLTSDINEEGGTIVASGAINATGQDVVINDTEDRFVFPAGTLTVAHAPLRDREHFNDKQCTGSVRETGRYVITEGSGAYAGVSGSGTYTVVARFQGDCQGGAPTGTVTISARGTINLPPA
jgi:hypothetical protein